MALTIRSLPNGARGAHSVRGALPLTGRTFVIHEHALHYGTSAATDRVIARITSSIIISGHRFMSRNLTSVDQRPANVHAQRVE